MKKLVGVLIIVIILMATPNVFAYGGINTNIAVGESNGRKHS